MCNKLPTVNRVINEYRFNAKFRQYVDEYASRHNMTLLQTWKQDAVRRACLMYEDE